MDIHTRNPICSLRWYHGMSLALAALVLSPLSVQVSIAQDGSTSITVSPPAVGSAPAPTVPELPRTPVQPATPESSAEAQVANTAESASVADSVATSEQSISSANSTVAAEASADASADAVSEALAATEAADAIVTDAVVSSVKTADSSLADIAEAAQTVTSDSNTSDSSDAELSTEAEFIDDLVIEEATEDLLANTSGGVRNLEFPLGTKPLLAGAPAWVSAGLDTSGDLHHLSVGSTPTSDPVTTDAALDEPLVKAVREYIDSHLTHSHGSAANMPISANYIRRNLLPDAEGYLAELTVSNGTMYQKWVRLEVAPAQRQQMIRWHEEAVQRQRIMPIAAGLASLVGLIGLSHLVLRRRNPPATHTPLAAEQVAQGENQPMPRKSSGAMGFLLVTGLVLAIPMLGMMSLVSVRRSASVMHGQQDGHTSQTSVQTIYLDESLPPMPPEVIEPPLVDSLGDLPTVLHESRGTVILDSGNQKVIVTRKGKQ